MSKSPRLGFTQLAAGQAVPETGVNEVAAYLEAASGLFNVLDRDLAAPPASPAQLDTYLVAASPTGAWSGQAGSIAVYLNTAWAFIAPVAGWIAWVDDEGGYIGYEGASWSALGLTLDDDVTLAADSSATAPTQHAVKAYVDAAVEAIPAGGDALAVASEWAPNWTGDADWYLPIVEAMTIDQGNAAIGTGTIAFQASTAAAPATFAAATLPVELEAGA